MPQTLVNRVKDYFNFLWVNTRGINDKFLKDLPSTLRRDIYLQIYKNGLENSQLFKTPSNDFDRRAALSFLNLIDIRKYMIGDILVTAGSLTTKKFFLLDGELSLIDINAVTIKEILPGTLINAQLEEGGKRQVFHIVSNKVSNVGILSQKNLDIFIKAFPVIKATYEGLAEKLFKKYKENTLSHIVSTTAESGGYESLLEKVFINLINLGILNWNRI